MLNLAKSTYHENTVSKSESKSRLNPKVIWVSPCRKMRRKCWSAIKITFILFLLNHYFFMLSLLENEIHPFCDSNVLRGFRCCGLAADPSLCMFVRISCPFRLLLLQSSFVKQMEVSGFQSEYS